jgi:hypothetical protein
MSISRFSARRLVVGAVGASAVAGAMLFGAIPMAQAASAPTPTPAATQGAFHAAPVWWGHHHHSHRHGGIHIA